MPVQESGTRTFSCLAGEEILRFTAGEAPHRREEFLEHLDRCESCRTLVAQALLGEEAPAGLARTLPRTLKEGDVLGRYGITRLIGSGGMGEVYEARDLELGEAVALKTLALPILDDPRALARMKSEVHLARKITHPNVCRVFDFGVHGAGRDGRSEGAERIPFLTMELLSGESLRSLLGRGGPLSPAHALPIVGQITAGLHAVHAAGVIHRDLKTENVFLAGREKGEPSRVVLMDFGLATVTRPSRASLTSEQVLVGTVAYMSPEQVQNRALSVRSDIYSLGVVMYEMLTGRLPFEGSSALTVAAARLHQPPTPMRRHVQEIDPRWERAVLRCLSRTPEERFATVDDLWAELQPRRATTAARAWPMVMAIGVMAIGGAAWMSIHAKARSRSLPSAVAPVSARPSTPPAPRSPDRALPDETHSGPPLGPAPANSALVQSATGRRPPPRRRASVPRAGASTPVPVRPALGSEPPETSDAHLDPPAGPPPPIQIARPEPTTEPRHHPDGLLDPFGK
jgi:serine/threonine protein kinase